MATERGPVHAEAAAPGTALRRWLLFLLLLVPLIALSLAYVQRTWVDVVWQDAFLHVPMIGNFLSGHGSLRELVGPFFGEHLLFGYRALMLLNAKLFSLDMRLDLAMSIAASTALAAIIHAEFSRQFAGQRPFVVALLFLPLMCLCFSLVAPPAALMTTQFVWGTVIALLAAWLLQRDSRSDCPREKWWTPTTLAVIALTIFYFFVLSGAYFAGFVGGIAVVGVARCLCTRRWLERRYWVVTAAILMCAALYSWLASRNVEGRASGGLGTFFSHPVDTLLSYVAGVGSSLVDIHTLEGHSQRIWLFLGFALLLSAIGAVVLFVKTRMYEKTCLPLYCMAYPLGIITMVRIGRASGGWAWIGNEWYNFHYRFFVIGVVWILLYVGVEAVREGWRPTRGWRTWTTWALALVVATAVLVGGSHFIANGKQWVRGPYIRYWLEEKRNALLYPDSFVDPQTVVLSPIPMDAPRAILQRYSLSSFSEHSLASLTPGSGPGILRFSGWSGDGWMGKRAAGAIISRSDTQVALEAFVPDFIPENRLTILVNNVSVFSGTISAGTKRTFTVAVHKGMNDVSVKCGRSASPASLGLGADQRRLSVRLIVAPD